VSIDDDGTYKLGDIWDYRDDPEGMIYGDVDQELTNKRLNKRDNVAKLLAEKSITRKNLLGYIIQPLE
jgi:hypothetical protein